MSRHALGVLFVHGIGEQPRGDTLLTFGEPLIRCVREWIDGREIGKADVTESKLSAAQLGSGEPAHAVLGITVGKRSPQTWLLAESWWADEFRRPPFMKLAGWLLTIGPWAIISHASRWLRAAPRKQAPYQLLKIVVAIPLSLLMQVVVASLAVLAWLPIPVLRRAVSGFLLRITGTLGDSYVLLENPVQKAAAIGALRHNVEWLADRCDTVAVVAHSQGAAIARSMLARHPHSSVCLLVTFGSGVAKLTELGSSMSTEKRARRVRTILAVSLVAIALLPRALSLTTDDDTRSLLWMLHFWMPLAMVIAAVTVVWGNIKAWPERAAKLSLSPLDWIDYWSTSDPVPNGPLAPAGTVAGLQQVRITNRINWFTDHSTYWENREEFVVPLARELDRRAGSGVFTVETPAVAGIPERRFRVWLLAGARIAIGALALPIVLFALRDQLAPFGRAALQSLSERPLTKPIAELLTGLGSFVGALLGLDAASLDRLGHAFVGALFPLVMMAAWYRFCVLPLWESWNTQCFEWLCRPARIPPHRADRALRPFLLVSVAMIPLVLAARALFQPDARLLLEESLNVVVASPIVVMAVLMLLFVVALIVQIPLLAVRGIRRLVNGPRATDPGAPARSASGTEGAGSDPEPPPAGPGGG